MINNSQYMKIIQYLSILGGLEPPPPAPPGSYAYEIPQMIAIWYMYVPFNNKVI